MRADKQPGIHFAGKRCLPYSHGIKRLTPDGGGEDEQVTFPFKLNDIRGNNRRPVFACFSIPGYPVLQRGQSVAVDRCAHMWHTTPESVPDHPAGFPVFMAAFTDEPDIGAEDEIAFQFLPSEMKMVRIKPDIVAGPGQSIFLRFRVEFRRTPDNAASYVAARVKYVS